MYRTFLDDTNERLRIVAESDPGLKRIYTPREELDERFMHKEDPSYVFNDFLTEANALLTDMDLAYSRASVNRNALNEEVAPMLKKLLEITSDTMKKMRNSPPEDTNS